MNIVTIDTKAELATHERSIETLFQACFGDRLSIELWRWAFLQNPCGDPVVTLCHDGDRLVAHYAIIPLRLRGPHGPCPASLSMTTMVAESHRQHGLFVKTAEACYARAPALGIAFVMGFPNAMSTPGFRRRLDWQLPEPDRVVSLDKPELLALAATGALTPPGTITIDLSDDAVRTWRLSRPGHRYVWQDGLAYKPFGDGIDLLYVEHPDALVQLPDDRPIQLIAPAEAPVPAERTRFPYQFGGLSLAGDFDASSVRRQMALSDVF